MGCGVAGEATAALRVLGRLAHEHTRALLQYAAFLSSVLDHLDTLSSSQLHQVLHLMTTCHITCHCLIHENPRLGSRTV